MVNWSYQRDNNSKEARRAGRDFSLSPQFAQMTPGLGLLPVV